MKKIHKIILGGLLATLIILIFSINFIVKNILTSAFEDKTGKTMTVGSLWINPFTGRISANGIDISEEDRSLFTLKSFRVESSPLALTKGKLHIDEITLIEPTIDITSNETEDTDSPQAPPDEVKEATEETVTAKDEIPEDKSEDPFIKEVIIKNVAVRNLIIKTGETQLKSLNTFTLEVPEFRYQDDSLNLSATLDIIDSGILNILLVADTDSGEVEGSLSSDSLILANTITNGDNVFDGKATFDGGVEFLGNYLIKEGEVSGLLNLKDISVSSSGTEIFSSRKIDLNIERATYPEISVISSGSYDISLTSEILPLALENNSDISIDFQGGDLKGTYEVDYPTVLVKSHLIAEEILIEPTEKLPYKGSLKILEIKPEITADLEEKSVNLESIIDLNSFDFADKDENSLFFRNGKIDLEFTSREEITETLINYIKFSSGDASFKGTQLNNMTLDISNVTDKKIDSPLVFSAVGSDFSKIAAKLNIYTEDMKEFSDLKVSGDIDIDSLKLASLDKFVEDLPYKLDGTISNSSYINYSAESITSVGKINGSNIKIAGEGMDLTLGSLNSTLDLSLKGEDMTLNNTTLAFNKLAGNIDKNTSVNLPDGSISIKSYTPQSINLNSLTLNSPVFTVVKVEEKEEPAQATVSSSSGSTEETSSEPAGKKDDEPLPDLFIRKMSIKNGEYHEIKGGKKTSFTSLKLYTENFTSKKEKNFILDTSASLEGVEDAYLKGTASLTEDWEFDPMTIKFKGNIGVSQVTLSTFNDQLSKSIPNKIEGGTLRSSGTLNLNRGVINSESKMTLSDLRLGEATGITSKVPLSRVIDALKDNNGDINIEVPVSGDLTDPEFKISAVVLDILIANFTNILKNPEKAISNILTIGSSNKEDVIYFDYLDSRPKSSDLVKLDNTIDLLTANPDSRLRVTIFTNDKVEEGIMKTKSLAGSLFGKKKESSSDQLEDLMDKRKEYIYNYLTTEISSNRIEIIISDRDKSLPQAKLELIQ